MKFWLKLGIAMLVCAVGATAATPVSTKPATKSKRKKYRSSSGSSASIQKKTPLKYAAHVVRHRAMPKGPPVSAWASDP